MSTLLEDIKAQIVSLKTDVAQTNIGTVREISDGVAKIEGLSGAALNEMLDFPGGITGIALNAIDLNSPEYYGYYGYGYPDFYYPDTYGYAGQGYGGYAPTSYNGDDYDAGYGGSSAWNGNTYGSSYGAPAQGQAMAQPQGSNLAPPTAGPGGQTCGKWVWQASRSQYSWQTSAC